MDGLLPQHSVHRIQNSIHTFLNTFFMTSRTPPRSLVPQLELPITAQILEAQIISLACYRYILTCFALSALRTALSFPLLYLLSTNASLRI